ncbi:MAG: hypothetical protein WD887_00770 [Candidatus Saccharimonadales bacterium]
MKRSASRHQNTQLQQQRALLIALSDDLALPLLQVKTGLEVLEQKDFVRSETVTIAQSMALSAEAGLQMVEAYRLVLRADQLENLPLQPLSIGAVLEDVAHRVWLYAKQYSTSIEVDVTGRLSPVLAHQPSLCAALEVLSTSLVRAQAAQSQAQDYRLILGAHRTADNVIAAGVFTNIQGLSDRTLRAARALSGRARQPLASVPPGAASGVLIADMLCTAMWQPLRAAAHRNMGGLATAIPATQQLNFV